MLAGKLISKYHFRIGVVVCLLLLYGVGVPLQGQGRLKIKKIIIEGNRHFPTKTLKEILKSREGKPFNTRLMKLDRILLKNFYTLKGFLDVFVSADFERKGSEIFIYYKIVEGNRYYLNEVIFQGNQEFSAGRLRALIPLKQGDVFNPNIIDESINRIENFYFDNGKPYAVISDERKVVSDSLINLYVYITEGKTVRIVDIDYEGLQRVKSFIIRRELVFKKGDVYSRKKIQESQRNIYNTGLFNFVNFTLTPVDTTQERVKVVVRVVEKKARWIGGRFGVAYDQEIVFGGTLDFTLEGGHRNLFGTGRSISFSVVPSYAYDFNRNQFINRKNQYTFTYVEPWVGYTRTPGILQISYFQVRPTFIQSYNSFNSSFRITHDFENYWSISAGINYQRLKTTEAFSLDSLENVYGLSVDLTRDRRNDFLNPSRGYLMYFGGRFVFSNKQKGNLPPQINRFFRINAYWNRYQAFPWKRKWVLASRFRGGVILELGKKTTVPLSERFFLGGASSLRGYREQLVGPVDRSNPARPLALGGKLLFLSNVELRIPLFWLLIGEVFTDAGNVWGEINQFRISSIKISSGIGLAILTPLGPVRFDYGVKWFPEPYESRGEFHIGISFAF